MTFASIEKDLRNCGVTLPQNWRKNPICELYAMSVKLAKILPTHAMHRQAVRASLEIRYVVREITRLLVDDDPWLVASFAARVIAQLQGDLK